MIRKLFLSVALALCGAGASLASIPVVKGEVWPDSEGKHINCHGGGILKIGDTYYWYGENREINGPQLGVACYASTDLKNWENKGIVLKIDGERGSMLEKGSKIERPKVIHNPATGKYVMWFHHELPGKGYGAAFASCAVADDPLGPFVMVKSGRVNPGRIALNMRPDAKFTKEDLAMEWWTPEWNKKVEEGLFVDRDLYGGQMSRDMTLYVDEDGTAYHIYSSEDNLTLQIAELDKDFTSHTGRYIRIFPGGHNEAPALFKKDGKYWMITSGCTGWAPNAARMMWSDSIMGEWHKVDNPCKGEGADKTFGGQGTYILQEGDDITFMADIWNPKNLTDSRHLWLPITFDKDGTPVINSAENY